MLEALRIQNIGLVSDIQIFFGPGLNVITGETGAGKSMTMSAIGLISGERVASQVIKEGAQKGTVEALFDLKNRLDLTALLNNYGFEPEEGQLIIKREILENGKSRCFINGSPVTLAQAKQVSDILIDVHGPHDHQSLLKQPYHLQILDNFGKLSKEKSEYKEQFAQYQQLIAEKNSILADDSQDESIYEFLAFQIAEIEQASLQDGEEAELIKEEIRLSNYADLRAAASEAYAELYQKDDAVLSKLAGIKKAFEKVAEVDDNFTYHREKLEEILIDLREMTDSVRMFFDGLDYDPQRLQVIEERLSLLSKLKRKHGASITEILEKNNEMKAKLLVYEDRDHVLDELNKKIKCSEESLRKKADLLSKERKKTATRLSAQIEEVLQVLGMKGAVFKIIMQTVSFTENGRDSVEFFISTNVGYPPRPLKEIASSGEVSRVMLAIKKIIAETDKIPILIFDEIDVNIGGKTAETVALRMKEIAESHQLLVISHLPQIAAKAEDHFVVTKKIEQGKTLVSLKKIEKQERVEEIARMLGGKDLTSVTLEHAKELLLR